MKGFVYQGRMAIRRRAACPLVILFTAAVTVFLLIYPQLIESTQIRLEEAYDQLTVSGWMVNTADFEDPTIPGSDWYTLLDSGYFSDHASYSTFVAGYFEKSVLQTAAGENATDTQFFTAFQSLMEEEDAMTGTPEYVQQGRAYNRLESCDDLVRMMDKIQWAEGWGPECLTGSERVCLMPQKAGYAPGDTVPMLAARSMIHRLMGRSVQLTVVGVYPATVPEFACVMPLATYEQICAEGEWKFTLNGFLFQLADNRRLDEVKTFLTSMGYDGSGDLAVRAAIDDRILKGTVAPIESNLALLQGLYLFFFAAVIAIGFFLCFLQARGRKNEYAVMRLLGESTAQVTCKALLEQMILCTFGIVLGSLIRMITGPGNLNIIICGIILACYTLGAALAVLLTVRVNVMEILRDKE